MIFSRSFFWKDYILMALLQKRPRNLGNLYVVAIAYRAQYHHLRVSIIRLAFADICESIHLCGYRSAGKYTPTQSHTNTLTRTHTRACVCACVRVCVYVCVLCVHVRVSLCTRACICVWLTGCAYMSVSVCTCVDRYVRTQICESVCGWCVSMRGHVCVCNLYINNLVQQLPSESRDSQCLAQESCRMRIFLRVFV